MEKIKEEIGKDGKKVIYVKYTAEELEAMKKKAEERRKKYGLKPQTQDK